MKIVTIWQAQFLPRLHFFKRIMESDTFILMDTAQLQRRGNKTLGEHGFERKSPIKFGGILCWLTIPIHGKMIPINECKVAWEQGWPKDGVRAVELAYRGAPHFREFWQEIKELLENQAGSLFDYNARILRWCFDKLGVEVDFRFQSQFETIEHKGRLMLELTKLAGGDVYHCGSDAVGDYVLFEDFIPAGVGLLAQGWVCPEYKQNGRGDFIRNLSIIDPLFNVGLEATKELLRG